jgi:hypothetical protein
MTTAPVPISHHHLPHHLPHLRRVVVLRVVFGLLFALAIMLLLHGDTSASEGAAFGAMAAAGTGLVRYPR